jgi:hypothetical protein
LDAACELASYSARVFWSEARRGSLGIAPGVPARRTISAKPLPGPARHEGSTTLGTLAESELTDVDEQLCDIRTEQVSTFGATVCDHPNDAVRLLSDKAADHRRGQIKPRGWRFRRSHSARICCCGSPTSSSSARTSADGRLAAIGYRAGAWAASDDRWPRCPINSAQPPIAAPVELRQAGAVSLLVIPPHKSF